MRNLKRKIDNSICNYDMHDAQECLPGIQNPDDDSNWNSCYWARNSLALRLQIAGVIWEGGGLFCSACSEFANFG